ncbi:MAG: 30S ribosomal protein S18 [Planctomycetes bacterium]|nr:30S ribosomal protein S18 [Planctomycetota bacterium]
MKEPTTRIRHSEEKHGLLEYKNVSLLQKFCSPQGKLFDRKRLGITAKQQRKIAQAVKRARYLGLLRYVGGR